MYHRCEWAIYGTGCSKIEAFFKQIEDWVAREFRLGYIDADHSKEAEGMKFQVKEKIFNAPLTKPWNEYDDKLTPLPVDAVFVNGNHYPASRQIVILNPEKKNSLERRKEQLTQIHILIKESEEQKVFDFVQERMTEETKIFTKDQLDSVFELILKDLEIGIPPLKALVLAGGKSQRMGKDKSQLVYRGGQPQELYIAELCRSLGLEPYISKGVDFEGETISGVPVIKDRMTDMGPFGAIISAFMHDPDAAWLVVACDLPFITAESLDFLIDQRYTSGLATAYKADHRPFPEPLITIYEPKAYPRFLSFLSLGYSCPRKVIINSDVRVLEVEDDSVTHNVNTPEQLEEVTGKLKTKTNK
jgi:molybdopterin-guanine dinucleotide biosynthesis protein A